MLNYTTQGVKIQYFVEKKGEIINAYNF